MIQDKTEYGVDFINGGSIGKHSVMGITTTSQLLKVYKIKQEVTGLSVKDITNQFTIVDTNLISNIGGEDTTNSILQIFWKETYVV